MNLFQTSKVDGGAGLHESLHHLIICFSSKVNGAELFCGTSSWVEVKRPGLTSVICLSFFLIYRFRSYFTICHRAKLVRWHRVNAFITSSICVHILVCVFTRNKDFFSPPTFHVQFSPTGIVTLEPKVGQCSYISDKALVKKPKSFFLMCISFTGMVRLFSEALRTTAWVRNRIRVSLMISRRCLCASPTAGWK